MSFSHVKGHATQKKILKHIIKKGEIPHAILFTGKEGIGKSLMATSFACALNCQDKQDSDSQGCGRCTACKKIVAGIHPDVQTISPDKGYIGVEAARELLEKTALSSFEGKIKVFIIKDADTLNRQAANSLLKTLEEPPPDTVFILTTSRPGGVLPTITSRCQTLGFSPILPELVMEVIREKTNVLLDEKKARMISSISSGSPGLAMQLLECNFGDVRIKALDLLAGNGIKTLCEVFDVAEQYSREDEEFKSLLFWLLTGIRDILMYQSTGRLDNIVNYDRHESLSALSACHDRKHLLQLFSFLEDIQKKMVFNLNKQIILEEILTRLRKNLTAVSS